MFFFNHFALRANPYQRTYKDQFPMVLEQPPTFFFQETNSVDSIPMSRTSYNESCQGGSRQFQKPWVWKDHLTWTSTCPLCTQEGWSSRNSVNIQGQHLKAHIGEDMTLHLSIWYNGTKKAMLMHVGLTLDANQETIALLSTLIPPKHFSTCRFTVP